MGRTREALKRAEDQYREHQIRISHEVLAKERGSKQGRASARKNMNFYGDLKNKLRIRNIDGSIRSILFIKTFKGGEFSDHAIKFATSLVEDLRIKVLLVDLNIGCLDLREAFEIDHVLFLSDLFIDEHKTVLPKKVGPGNLYKIRWGGNHSSLAEAFISEEFDRFRKSMYEKFDYLVLNVPEGANSRECRLLCSKVDAVVLILKSDKIADRIALNAKNYFQNSADKVLGFVISNTRTYRHKFLKTASMAVMLCLIFASGFLIGNGNFGVFSKIKKAPENYEKSISHVQPMHKSNITVFNDFNHNTIPEKKISTEKKVAREKIQESPQKVNLSIDLIKDKSPMAREIVPSILAKPIEKPIAEHIAKEIAEPIEKPIAKAMTIPENHSDENNEVQDRKERVVIVQRGETLFRIIYKNYGKYNDKIARLVLHENPKILGPSHIKAGQSIKLPDINKVD